MIKIVRANRLNKNIKVNLSKLFVDSFYSYFAFINNKEKLYKAFKHIFDLNNFYVVLLDDEVIGMGACCDGESSIKFNKSILCLSLGIKDGKRIYDYLKVIFEDRDYSFDIDKECGMIEFVAVKEMYRNKKIGYTLINHMMCDNGYKRYLAKVGDNNHSARKVLENIGCEVFDEESATGKEKEEIGINNYLYMICENPRLSKEV